MSAAPRTAPLTSEQPIAPPRGPRLDGTRAVSPAARRRLAYLNVAPTRLSGDAVLRLDDVERWHATTETSVLTTAASSVATGLLSVGDVLNPTPAPASILAPVNVASPSESGTVILRTRIRGGAETPERRMARVMEAAIQAVHRIDPTGGPICAVWRPFEGNDLQTIAEAETFSVDGLEHALAGERRTLPMTPRIEFHDWMASQITDAAVRTEAADWSVTIGAPHHAVMVVDVGGTLASAIQKVHQVTLTVSAGSAGLAARVLAFLQLRLGEDR